MACRVDLAKVPAALLTKAKKMCTIKITPPPIGKRSRKMFARTIHCYHEELDTITNAEGKLVYRKILYLPKYFDSMMRNYLVPQPAFRVLDVSTPTHYKLLDANDQLDRPEDRRRDQVQVLEEMTQKLMDYGTCLFQGSTGYGKTKTIIYMLTKIKTPVAIVVNNKRVRKQWVDELGLAGFLVQTKGKPSRGFNAYVYGPQTVKKLSRTDLAGIGVLVMDELHTCAETAVKDVMLRFAPDFLIGASATPYTSSNIDDAFPLYYGDQSQWIVRMLKTDFVAFQVYTGVRLGANVPTTALGTISHSTAMEHFYNDEGFQEMMYKLTQKIGDRRCMVMFERAEVGAGKFVETLERHGCTDYSTFYGDTDDYEKKKILVTTIQKGGTGFDDPGITVLLLACDRNDVMQAKGRIRVSSGGFIFDFVHDRKNQYEHAVPRKLLYMECGGVVMELCADDIDQISLDTEGYMVSEESEQEQE